MTFNDFLKETAISFLGFCMILSEKSRAFFSRHFCRLINSRSEAAIKRMEKARGLL